jgi:hypothetical protein
MRIVDAVFERFGAVGWKAATMVALIACTLWPMVRTHAASVPVEAVASYASSAFGSAAQTAIQAASEWPRVWNGRALRPLALSPVEQRFAAGFPGRIVRLTDGEQTLVWREVKTPTRMLHPAVDCYRALGFAIDNALLERDAEGLLWRCFIAERGGQRIRVCERIVDARGASFTDTSSWFWSAQLGESVGPWQAITTARPL